MKLARLGLLILLFNSLNRTIDKQNIIKEVIILTLLPLISMQLKHCLYFHGNTIG